MEISKGMLTQNIATILILNKRCNMNKFIIAIILSGLLIGCASNPSNISSTSQGRYYDGDGGKEMRLGIIVPKSEGLSSDLAYLPRMIQGTFVSNISKYSAISVVDRVSLDEVIAETLDPMYEDNFNIVRLGHVTHAGYMMTGNVTRTSTGYNLRANIIDTTPNSKTIASYSGIFTATQLDDLSAINQATESLLSQMGIQLTDAAKNELSRASATQSINAQTTMAKGILAQQRGTVVEAWAYFQSAKNFDSTLTEASKRMATISANIRSGNIGIDARNAIAARNAWVPILNQATNYYNSHLPIEIKYTPNLKQTALNYAAGTVDLQFSVSSYASDNIQIINDVLSGLKKTGKKKEWGFEQWPGTKTIKTDLEFALLNEGNKIISTQRVQLNNQFRFGKKPNTGPSIAALLTGAATGYGAYLMNSNDPSTEPHSFGPYEGGLYLTIFSSAATGILLVPALLFPKDNVNKIVVEDDKHIVSFRNVNANDITDKLTIKILTVNGRNAEEATQSGYIRIIVGT